MNTYLYIHTYIVYPEANIDLNCDLWLQEMTLNSVKERFKGQIQTGQIINGQRFVIFDYKNERENKEAS